MGEVAENTKKIRDRIMAACDRAGRAHDEVTLVAVTKNVPVDRVLEGIDSGIEILGENRVQEAKNKRDKIHRPVSWHLIRHLQTNKVRYCLGLFDVIQSVDSLRLAREISKRYTGAGQSAQIMIELNISREQNKFGIDPEDAVEFTAQVGALPGIRVIGLMAIAPFFSDPLHARPHFKTMKQYWDRVAGARIPGVDLGHLSMGMTNDFEVAIEEGSTMVRIGTGIFGGRQ